MASARTRVLLVLLAVAGLERFLELVPGTPEGAPERRLLEKLRSGG